jgi:hypothetical protein
MFLAYAHSQPALLLSAALSLPSAQAALPICSLYCCDQSPAVAHPYNLLSALLCDGGCLRRQQSVFFEDTGIEPRFRSKLEDYWQSGYDRGHLVSAPPACIACNVGSRMPL